MKKFATSLQDANGKELATGHLLMKPEVTLPDILVCDGEYYIRRPEHEAFRGDGPLVYRLSTVWFIDKSGMNMN